MEKIRNSEDQPNQRQFIYSLKAFAILSVICAHTASVSKLDSFSNVIAGKILNSLGSIGVVVFFIIAGFLFANSNYSLINFFKKRVITILIPWVATGTIVYCYVAIRKNGINLIDWLYFITGNKSYLYFLPMLLACYLISFLINKSLIKLILIVIFSLLCILLTTNNLLTQINPYMNPFNWFFYFGIGYLLFIFNKLYVLVDFAKRNFFLLGIIFILCLFAFSIHRNIGYWTREYLFFEFISVNCIFAICSLPSIYESKLINIIGKESFSIYLIHMPFAGVVAYLLSFVDFAPVTLIRPFLVLFLSLAAIYVFKLISKKLKMDSFLPILIGSRE
ncbi:MAG TPA: acyltransferase [Methylotenera sp.]